MPSRFYRCKFCGARWAQHLGLCRACQRLAGIHTTIKDFERQRVDANRARLANLPRAPASPPRRTVVIDGVEYEVVGPR